MCGELHESRAALWAERSLLFSIESGSNLIWPEQLPINENEIISLKFNHETRSGTLVHLKLNVGSWIWRGKARSPEKCPHAVKRKETPHEPNIGTLSYGAITVWHQSLPSRRKPAASSILLGFLVRPRGAHKVLTSEDASLHKPTHSWMLNLGLEEL